MKGDFIVHSDDYAKALREIPIESVGRLFLALIAYAREEESQEILSDDVFAKSLFFVMQGHIDRDNAYKERKSIAGKKGGAPIGNKNASRTTTDNEEQAETTKNNQGQPKTTKDNQKQTPNPKPNPKPNPYKEYIVEILAYLNEKAGTKYGESKESVKLITARLNDHFTVDDFKKVIDKKVKEWKGTEQAQYIRPSTLFAPSHFEEYLNAPEKGKTSSLAGQNSTNIVNRFKQRDDYDFEAIERKLIRN